MRIAVVGVGYVGLVSGACLAQIGHEVVCTDNDAGKIASLQAHVCPIYEENIQQMLDANTAEGRLRFTTDAAAAIEFAEVVFICVGTPPLENGDADLSAIERVAQTIATHSTSPKLVIEKSTVPVRTGERVQKALEIYSPKGAKFRVASNPEFLREGTAVGDFMHPDRVVVGVNDPETEQQLRQLYAPILERKFPCPVHAQGCPESAAPVFVVTTISSAELIKHASNSFLAMKISYANLIADFCDRMGGDVDQVTAAMGLDPRIGAQFLRAGLGFGGFCFPKDLQAFIRLGEKAGVDVDMLKAVQQVNRHRLDRFLEAIREALWIVRGKRIGILGMSFKPNTDDIRFSPALELARRLIAEGATVCAYDPQALPRATAEVAGIVPAADEYAVAENSDALVIATEWPQFARLDWERIRGSMARPLLLDGRNLLDPATMRQLGFEYYSFGRPFGGAALSNAVSLK
jgi:UDPglucose 6-dehydrogenase